MPDFIAKILSKGMLLIVGMQLSACSQWGGLADRNLQPIDITAIRSIDFAALNCQGLLSYDVYSQGFKLHGLFAAKKIGSDQPCIGYLHSVDKGRSWSVPVEIPNVAAAGLESTLGNEVQIAASADSLMAVLQQTGEIPGMGPLMVLYSEDDGKSWYTGSNPTVSTIDQSHPELIADPQGHFHLVWLDDRDENGYQGVRYARSADVGKHWELAQTIDDSSCSCCWNRLWLDWAGNVNLLYRDMQPRDMALAQSADSGKSWQRIGSVGEFNWTFDGCPHNGGGLAGNDVNLHALVWTGVENKSGLYYLQSADNGKHWSAPQAMGAGTLAFHSDIAALGSKRVLAVWDATGADGSRVMMSESLDSGSQWSVSKQLSSPGSSASFPRIVATDGGFLAMWLEQKPGGFKQWMTAILE
ncbi:MAG: sialidase [Methylomonas sp.]|nr:MAG: sialidase [Methylomonas sp.]